MKILWENAIEATSINAKHDRFAAQTRINVCQMSQRPITDFLVFKIIERLLPLVLRDLNYHRKKFVIIVCFLFQWMWAAAAAATFLTNCISLIIS